MTHVQPVIVILVLAISSLCRASQSEATVEARVDSLVKQLTLEEKIDLLGGVEEFYIRENKRIGLPRLKMADGPIGVRNYGPSTTFAGGIALAATWDPELVQRAGTVIGRDARARGVHFLLGPGVNIYRAPMCGRNFEYFGEDPFLASRMAVAYIKGVQSQGVSATIKHFMGNNQEYDRHNMDSVIDERTMREIYLPVFEAAVKEAHVGAIMDSYNLTNGLHMTANGYLNIDVAKKEWGFDGIIMSDWDSTYDAVAAANGGLDLEMPSGKHLNRTTLLPAIQAGKITKATIDDKVRRILRKAVQFGWLDHAQTDPSIPLFNLEGRQVALEAARSSMVLLKNNGNLLPLKKAQIKSIAIIGPDAYPAQPVGGGSAAVQPFVAVSYMEGLANYLGNGASVYYHRGLPTLDEIVGATEFATEASGGERGLRGEFFNNPNLAGAPTVARRDEHVRFSSSFGGGIAQNEVSARWTGYFTPETPGEYLVFLQGPGENGGYRFYLDKKLIVDNWKYAHALVSEVKIPLQPGAHQVELEYFVHGSWGGTGVNLGIVRPGSLVDAEAKALASRSDAVVIAVGFDPFSESEGADRTFQLPPGQDELINQISATNQNTIVVITSGGGVNMNAWIDRVPALLQSWYSGQEGGAALAQLLFGEYSPSGRLPVTFERHWEDSAVYNSYYPQKGERKVEYTEGVFLGYRHFDKSGIKPLFPFGYGLSYTDFTYKNLSVAHAAVSGDEPVTISFDVTNTGNRAGAEIAQLYVGDRNAGVPRPVKELKGFAKVYLNPRESKRVTITLDRKAFSYYDVRNHRWMIQPGDFGLYVGRSAAQIELTGKIAFQ